VCRATSTVVCTDAVFGLLDLFVDLLDRFRQIAAPELAAAMPDDAAQCVQGSVAQRLQSGALVLDLTQPFEVDGERFGIQGLQARGVAGGGFRLIELGERRRVQRDRAAEIGAAIAAIEIGSVVIRLEPLLRFLDCGRLGLGVAKHVRRHPLPQCRRAVEKLPGRTIVEWRRDVGSLRVFLAFVVRRMRGPHPWDLCDCGRE